MTIAEAPPSEMTGRLEFPFISTALLPHCQLILQPIVLQSVCLLL